ncbi:hypothetical protein H5410_018670 [Solanum commersonii]|uniref:Uncharacterized protein n=1 Tax=Solanum commersonii TaxID=4109 RepID=A0A9J6A2K8_SOLCO|nr:hypothetical protein H5410_018670 [Solanum commersonii]
MYWQLPEEDHHAQRNHLYLPIAGKPLNSSMNTELSASGKQSSMSSDPRRDQSLSFGEKGSDSSVTLEFDTFVTSGLPTMGWKSFCENDSMSFSRVSENPQPLPFGCAQGNPAPMQ